MSRSIRRLDRGNFVEQIRRRAFRKNERLKLAQEIVGQFAVAADPPRLDQREPLPHFAKAGVIIFHALERTDERPGAAFRAQTQIDAEERTGRVGGGKSLDDLVPESGEPFVVAKLRGQLSLLAVDKDEIDIGTVIQFSAAQFSQADDRELTFRRAPALAQFGIPVIVDVSLGRYRPAATTRSAFLRAGRLPPLRATRSAPSRDLSKNAECESYRPRARPGPRGCADPSASGRSRGDRRKRRDAPAREESPGAGSSARRRCSRRKADERAPPRLTESWR